MKKQATVLRFDRARGIGWAVPDDLGADVFIHRNHLPADHRYLNGDDRIEYEVGEFNGRSCAINIKVIGRVIARQISAGTAKAEGGAR